MRLTEIIRVNGKEYVGIKGTKGVYANAERKGAPASNAIVRLAAYEDAEEQGLLVRLPCKVGDTVYRVVRHRVDVTGYRMEWEWETVVEAVPFRIGMVDAIGKTVFLTRKEAEAALNNKIEKEN